MGLVGIYIYIISISSILVFQFERHQSHPIPNSSRIEGTPVSYKTGDSLAVWPRNPLDKVEAGHIQSVTCRFSQSFKPFGEWGQLDIFPKICRVVIPNAWHVCRSSAKRWALMLRRTSEFCPWKALLNKGCEAEIKNDPNVVPCIMDKSWQLMINWIG